MSKTQSTSRRFDRGLFEAIECGRISANVTADVRDWYEAVKAGRIELRGI